MFLLIWIVTGAIVGWIASAIMGTRTGLGMDILIGIVGSILGGLIFGLFGLPHSGLWGFLAAIIGAVILLAIVRAVRRPTVTGTGM